MDRLGTVCSSKLLVTWGFYSLIVTVLCHAIDAAGLPGYLAWLMAGALAIATLVATSEL
jgi:hypothetical protein